MDPENVIIKERQDRESIKISKNSKGYSWDIRVISEIDKKISPEDVERVKIIDQQLKEEWGKKK